MSDSAALRPTLPRRLARRGLAVLVQIVIILALLEIAGRVLDPLGISYYPETARYFDTLVLEEPIGYRNRPGLIETFYGVPVTISPAGLRDREIGPKSPGEYRILVLGDSVPFGIGVREEDSFPRQLELRLNEGAPAPRTRTINMGVPSYNTEQQLVQLQTAGLAFGPDAVMLLFSNNDIEPKMWVLDKRRQWYVDLIQRSYAGSLLYVLAREVRLRWLFHTAGPEAAALAALSGVALDQYRSDSPRWQAIDRSLATINALCRERKIPFVLFTNNELPFIEDLLAGVARREGFPLVSLNRRADPRWADQDERLFRNSVTDPHPSALGNRVLATLIAERLRQLGIPHQR